MSSLDSMGFLSLSFSVRLFELQTFRVVDFFRQTSTGAIIASFPPVDAAFDPNR